MLPKRWSPPQLHSLWLIIALIMIDCKFRSIYLFHHLVMYFNHRMVYFCSNNVVFNTGGALGMPRKANEGALFVYSTSFLLVFLTSF